ncbi:TetR family transcriptional regulator [Melaminivora suipulveris]|uniref:TetR family transcriptional regulator n=1 Tax=Melaminivora suipulveris TaxID=2109913 RepID=A0A2R3QD30_9BURK|nr:TetR family transcriptional regulator [Melaminivora suipulveris]AVO49675.1 TetR family transcriptional regulator [Melaminivora suipulveris]
MARRTKDDADATRHRLLDAAERVFHDKGVARASLSEIAQAAGATRGAIYWHFKDKVDLFNAMMDRVTLPLELACNAGEAACATAPLQRLRALVDHLLGSIESDEHTRRVFEIAMYRVEYVSELSSVRERHRDSQARFHALLARDLEAAAREAAVSLPLDVPAAATGLWALFDGLLQTWILNGAPFALRATGRQVVDVYLRGLGFRW